MRDFQQPGRSPVYAREGMASTSHPLATQTALDVLKAGGNALDAAIAACAVQCVVEPQSTGIGGDCFCLYAPLGSTDMVAFNGSGRTPAALSYERFVRDGLDLSRTSPHSVIVPGAVDAWFQLNRDHGRMPLSELLQPAIQYARDGFPISPRVAHDISRNAELFETDSHLKRLYLKQGQLPVPGDVLVLSELAETLQTIAAEGRDGFYLGPVAADMVDTLQARGGLHTMTDFAAACGEYVIPISTRYRDHTVYECPPNGQGVIALLLLNMMAQFDRPGVTADDAAAAVLDPQRLHLEIEACRQAYHVRTRFVADPDVGVPVESILSSAYAGSLAAAIDPLRATEAPVTQPFTPHQDTVYISVVDRDRNACSFINTLFWGFGSGITAGNSGVVFTNRGEGFVLDEHSPNRLDAGKRPMHTIIPGMLARDDQVVMSFGVMGGEYQAMGHMQFLTRYLDFGLDIQQAQDLPRFMVDPFTGAVDMESGIPEASLQQLRSMGHRLQGAAAPIGGSQAIAIDWSTGVLSAGSDPRKDGQAAGY